MNVSKMSTEIIPNKKGNTQNSSKIGHFMALSFQWTNRQLMSCEYECYSPTLPYHPERHPLTTQFTCTAVRMLRNYTDGPPTLQLLIHRMAHQCTKLLPTVPAKNLRSLHHSIYCSFADILSLGYVMCAIMSSTDKIDSSFLIPRNSPTQIQHDKSE